MPLQLRDYQHNAIHQLREKIRLGRKRIILCMPTGAGKSLVFATMVKNNLNKELFTKCLILTDRIELLTQNHGTLQEVGIYPSLIKAGGKINLKARCWIGMIETFYNRIKSDNELLIKMGGISILILDEAHKATFRKIIPFFPPDQLIIGATATPLSASKLHPLKDYFEDIVTPVKISELINARYLSKAKTYAPIMSKGEISEFKLRGGEFTDDSQMTYFKQPKIFKGVVDNWLKYANDKRTLIFCVNIEHAELTRQSFVNADINAECVTSQTNHERRVKLISEHKENKYPVLTNCGILTMGYDDPQIECIIIYRATMSMPLFFQMIGRGSRTTGTKDTFIILDHGNNIVRHGFWENDMDWSAIFFNPKLKKADKVGVTPVKKCPQCEALVHASKSACDFCGFIFPKKIQKEKEAEFKELINWEAKRVELSQIPVNEMTVEQLSTWGLINKFKPGWIFRQLHIRGNFESDIYKLARIRGYKQGWAWNIIQRSKSKASA